MHINPVRILYKSITGRYTCRIIKNAYGVSGLRLWKYVRISRKSHDHKAHFFARHQKKERRGTNNEKKKQQKNKKKKKKKKTTKNKKKKKHKKKQQQKKNPKTPDVKPPTHKHRRMQQRNHLGTTTGAWGGGGRGSNIWNDRRTKNRNRGTALKWSVGNYLGWCGLYYFFFFSREISPIILMQLQITYIFLVRIGVFYLICELVKGIYS